MKRKIWPFTMKSKPKVEKPTLAKLEEDLRQAIDNRSYAIKQNWTLGGYEAAVEVARHQLIRAGG